MMRLPAFVSTVGTLRQCKSRWKTAIARLSMWWARQSLLAHVCLWLVMAACVLLMPLALPEYWQGVLFFPIGVFVLLALGLNVVVGMAGLLDLGYVAFYAVGAYVTAVLSTTYGWNPAFALPVAVISSMAAGVALGAPTLRLRGDYLAIVTLGFGEIVRIVATNSEPLGQARGIVGIPHPDSFGPLKFDESPLSYYYVILIAIVLAVVMVLRLARSRVGRAWTALREDEEAAEAMGVHVFAMKLWAFAIGASTGGLAGWFYATKVGFINPDNFPFFFSITILAAVVLGGLGSIRGVIAGAVLVAFIPEYLRDGIAGAQIASLLHGIIGGTPADASEYRIMLFGAALVLTMLFRPGGLLPSRRRARELAGNEAGTNALQPAASSGAENAGNLGTIAKRNAEQLHIDHLSVRFGGIDALRDVSMHVEPGEIVGIIGPNGAGKTTLFNCLTGVTRTHHGEIRLGSRRLNGLRPHRITHAGLARTFQSLRLFPNMTVMENVLVGADTHHRTSVPGALLGIRRHRREERAGRLQGSELLAFVGIGSAADRVASQLSYGDQRRLEIARALSTGAGVVLLDEPAAGMNPSEKQALMGLISRIRECGITIVMIEHDMKLVMGVCDRILVLDFGETIAAGTPAEVQNNPRVIAAYLGETVDASRG